MRVAFSPDLDKEFKRLYKTDKKLTVKIKRQLDLFKDDPKHPSLRNHKLAGNLKNHWSISITRSVRMVYVQKTKDIAYFIDVGTHEEVYKK